MNPSTDDPELEKYLSRGSEVSRQYRALAREEPPAALDRDILAQARAAVESSAAGVTRIGGRKTVRWAVPLALAATFVLTIAIVRDIKVDAPLESTAPVLPRNVIAVPETPAPSPVPERTESRAKEKRALSKPAATSEPAIRLQVKKEAQPPAPEPGVVSVTSPVAALNVPIEPAAALPPAVESVPAPAAVIVPTSASGATPELDRSVYELEQKALTSTSNSNAAPRAKLIEGARRPSVSLDKAKDVSAVSPREAADQDAWLKKIRELRKKGDAAEADRQLDLFLKLYPDYFKDHPAVVRP